MAMKVTKGGKALVARIENAATLAFFGADLARIAEKMEVSYDTIRDWKKYEVWNATLERLRETQRQAATTKIEALTIQAIEGIQDSLQSVNEAIRLRASIWWLERGKANLEAEADVALKHDPCPVSYNSKSEHCDSPQAMLARFRQHRLELFHHVYGRDPVDEDDWRKGSKALRAEIENEKSRNRWKPQGSPREDAISRPEAS